MKKDHKILALSMTAALLVSGMAVSTFAETAVNQEYYQSDLVPMYPNEELPEEDSYPMPERQYTFQTVDADNAILTEVYVYDYGLTATSEYQGTYSKEADGTIQFLFRPNDDPEAQILYTLWVQDEKIEDVLIRYGNQISLIEYAGTYTGTDIYYGDLELTIDENCHCVMTTSHGEVFEGSISVFDGKPDLMVNTMDDDNPQYIDWFVELDGSTFTHTTFSSAMYGGHEGTYTAVGDLGEITFDVDENGTVVLNVTLNGQNLDMTGNIYVDYDTQAINGFYVTSYTGYTMSVDLVELSDGVLNYSGSYSVPLAAG